MLFFFQSVFSCSSSLLYWIYDSFFFVSSKSMQFCMMSGVEIIKAAECQVHLGVYYDSNRKPVQAGLLDTHMVRSYISLFSVFVYFYECVTMHVFLGFYQIGFLGVLLATALCVVLIGGRILRNYISFVCWFQGPANKNSTCQTCGAGFHECPGHFGYLNLVLPVFNVGYISNILDILKCICKVSGFLAFAHTYIYVL